MKSKAPNKLIAPIVIAGITLGFFVSAYKFIFAKGPEQKADLNSQTAENETTLEK